MLLLLDVLGLNILQFLFCSKPTMSPSRLLLMFLGCPHMYRKVI